MANIIDPKLNVNLNSTTVGNASINNENNKNLYVPDIGNQDSTKTVDPRIVEKQGLKATNINFLKDINKTASDTVKSVKDLLLPKSKRNKAVGVDFIPADVSIANRQKDIVQGILTDAYNGNLFDAGGKAIQLYNIGTKWTISLDQWVDKDAYSFRYWYYLDKNISNKSTQNESENDSTISDYLSFLDSVEDPTILGASFKIDQINSPLFSSASVANDSSLTSFITNYVNKGYKELNYAQDYLNEFRGSILKILTSPETLGVKQEYKNSLFKNHYVTNVGGLDKLDNLFVEYKDGEDRLFNTEQETLTFTLNEDVRMYTNRIAFLYRNLTHSYNMGKRLIPENLLRFNLYIKVSEMRNYTHNEASSPLAEVIRNQYSRVIYELKDCEFFFPQSLNPSDLSLGGFGNSYASLQMKIKYRKVNRIFYSAMYDPSFEDFLIGDKYFKPDVNKYLRDLKNIRYDQIHTAKRPFTSNNIPVVPKIRERFDTLKNFGVFTQDDNDNALTRFAKVIGNDAVKAGAHVVSNQVQSIKSQINAKVGGSVRSFLQQKVFKKTVDLGVVGNKQKEIREVTTNTSIPDALNVTPEFNYKTNDSGTINDVAGIPSSKFYNYKATKPSDANLSPDPKFKFTKPNENLSPDPKFKFTKPNENLSPDPKFKYVKPSDANLSPDPKFKYTTPNENLSPASNFKYSNPSENLSPASNFKYSNPSDANLSPDPKFKFTKPNENLSPDPKFKYVKPSDANLSPDPKFKYTTPNENLNNGNISPITNPIDKNINGNVSNKITAPNENLSPDPKFKYTQSDKFDSIESYKKFLKSNGGKPL